MMHRRIYGEVHVRLDLTQKYKLVLKKIYNNNFRKQF